MTRVRALLAMLALLAAGLLAGCGGDDPTPAESVPALRSALTSIDEAIVDGDVATARSRLRSLLARVDAAREDGSLGDSDADAITAAAKALLARLPSSSPSPSSTPTPTSSPTPSSTPAPTQPQGPGKPGKDKPGKPGGDVKKGGPKKD